MSENQEWLTESAAADRVGVSAITLKRWRRDGKGPAYYRIGGGVRYKSEDIDSYISGARVEPGKE